MSNNITDVFYTKSDLGKNVYRKKTYYTVVVEQDVLAKDQDEADRLLSECGIDYEQINNSLAEEKNGVETYSVDCDYTDSDSTEYLGKVVYDPDDEYAEEDGSVIIDTYAEETAPKEKSPMEDLEGAFNGA